jgi:putative transposase
LAALLDRHDGRRRKAAYPEFFYDDWKKLYLRSDQPAATAARREAAKIAVARDIDADTLPKCISLMRRLRLEVPWQSILYARKGEQALHRTYPTQRRDRSELHALESVNGDGYRWNIAAIWPDGEICRPLMFYFQDDYSGIILAWRIDRSENSGLVRLTIGDLCREHGIPPAFIIDNTMAAAAKWISGRSPSRHRFKIKFEEPQGLIGHLGSRHIATLPRVGGSSKRGERAGGDWDRDIARSPALDGAWLGTNPMTRPDAARKPVPLATFLEVVRAGIAEHNARPGRRGANCNGRSLLETYRESYERSVIRKPTPEQLRLCMLAAERVLCQKIDGSIQLYGNVYWSETTARLAGERIIVRFDPDRLQQPIYIYSGAGAFVGEAECRGPVEFWVLAQRASTIVAVVRILNCTSSSPLTSG